MKHLKSDSALFHEIADMGGFDTITHAIRRSKIQEQLNETVLDSQAGNEYVDEGHDARNEYSQDKNLDDDEEECDNED